MMRIVGFSLFFMVFLVLSGCEKASWNEKDLPLYSKTYAPEHDPEADLEFALKEAEETQRRVLIFVGGNWCPWCRALDQFLMQEKPALNAFLHRHYVLLKVYYGKENYNRNFLSGFPLMPGTPHFYVLEADGTLIHSQPTEVLEKGRSYDGLKLRAFLEKWAPDQS